MIESNRINPVVNNGFIWSFFFIWQLLIAMLWPGEEPGKLNTVIVCLMVFTIAVVVLNQAKRMKIIESTAPWMFTFMVMMTLIPFILQYSWIMTDLGHRALGDYFDPVRYDYMGKWAAENNLDFSRARKHINYVGIVYYIAFIYWVFGVSTFYVSLWNLLFSLVAFLSVTAILVAKTGKIKPWQNMRWGLLYPSVLFYSTIPGKDVLAMSLIAVSISIICRLLDRPEIKWYLLLAISLLSLATVRGSAVPLVLLTGIAFVLLDVSRRRFFTTFLPAAIVALIFIFIVPKVIVLSGGTEHSSIPHLYNIEQKIHVSERSSDENSLNLLFTPKNFFQMLLFTPVRTVFLLVAPFPKLWFMSNEYTKIKYTTVSTWIILFFMPSLIAATTAIRCMKQRVYRFVVIPFWLMLAVISISLFMIHERYRLMVVPFWLATVLVGLHYGKPKRYIVLAIGMICTGLASYYLLKW